MKGATHPKFSLEIGDMQLSGKAGNVSNQVQKRIEKAGKGDWFEVVRCLRAGTRGFLA